MAMVVKSKGQTKSHTRGSLMSTFMASPFASKLGTNYCPTYLEISQILDIIRQPTADVLRLDSKLVALQQTVKALAEERRRLSTFIQAHRALISPFRLLPLDLIREIFVACLRTDTNSVMSANEAPVLLTRVCRSWRDIALATPSLWTRLHIVEPSHTSALPFSPTSRAALQAKLQQRTEVITMWLTRARQLPLSISLESPFPASAFRQPDSSDLLRELIPFAGRWKRLELAVSLQNLGILRHLTPNDVPQLEKVSLCITTHTQPPQPDWSTLQLLAGPSITSLCIAGINFVLQDIPVRWGQLTELSLGISTQLTVATMLEVLRCCPKLKCGRMRVDDWTTTPEILQTYTAVQSECLCSFELHCSPSMPSPLRILPLFVFPALQDLVLHPASCGEDVSFPDAFFSTSSRLETLRLSTHVFTKATLQALIRALPPTLQRLWIQDSSPRWGVDTASSDSPLDDDLLQLLTPTASECLCPALECLVMMRCSAISDAALARFICARSAATSLKRIRVQLFRQVEADVFSPLKELKGLHITVSHIPPMVYSPHPRITDYWGRRSTDAINEDW
ncbi:hypothetical protein C8F01DRAFT_264376 [Mycena amicta]|nr:hypothetical protein C8F01DRAFT_264376 [Mycena amicta]